MSLDLLKIEYTDLKNSLTVEEDTLLIMENLSKDIGRIYSFLKKGVIDIEPFYQQDESGEPQITNQDDIDVMNNRIVIFDEYISFMGINKNVFIEQLVLSMGISSRNPFNIASEHFNKLIGGQRTLIDGIKADIFNKLNEIKDELMIADGFTP